MIQILITGASTGIGFYATKEFLTRGFKVFAGVRDPQVLKALESQFPQTLRILKLDVTKTTDILNAKIILENELDLASELVLVNNAGIALGGPFEAIQIEKYREIFDVNVFGLIETTHSLLPLIRKTKGRVINVGSISGRIASPYLSPYTASKFAVRSLTDALRREMIPLGVKVILIEPGPVQTPIWSKSIYASQRLEKQISKEILEVYEKPLKSTASGIEKVVSQAAPVDWVTNALLEAVTARNPKPYYLVGKGIRILAILGTFLPTRLLDRVLSQGFRGSS